MNAVVDWQLPGTTRDREVWMARHGPPDGLDRFLRHGPAEIDRSGNEHVPRILGAMAPPDGSRPPVFVLDAGHVNFGIRGCRGR